jgi:hypothetical protein
LKKIFLKSKKIAYQGKSIAGNAKKELIISKKLQRLIFINP